MQKSEAKLANASSPEAPSLSIAVSSYSASCQGWSSAALAPPLLLIFLRTHQRPAEHRCRKSSLSAFAGKVSQACSTGEQGDSGIWQVSNVQLAWNADA